MECSDSAILSATLQRRKRNVDQITGPSRAMIAERADQTQIELAVGVN